MEEYVVYKDKYRVYRDGRVESIARGFLIGSDDKGENRINIVVNSKPIYMARHRFIATVFLPNPHNRIHVKFKDGNKNNCHVDNLQWVDILLTDEPIPITEDEYKGQSSSSPYRYFTIHEDGHLICYTKNLWLAAGMVGILERVAYKWVNTNHFVNDEWKILKVRKDSEEYGNLRRMFLRD